MYYLQVNATSGKDESQLRAYCTKSDGLAILKVSLNWQFAFADSHFYMLWYGLLHNSNLKEDEGDCSQIYVQINQFEWTSV